tara:strand:- start:1104 stop:1838 length:735 start_codon:yes stop_codon:yes gene_type:complete
MGSTVAELADKLSSASNKFAIDGATLHIDTLNDKVGIGSITPDGKLEVRQSGTDDIFNLYDDSTNVFTVLDGGNVGIGIDPTEKLQVAGNIKVSDGATIGTVTTANALTFASNGDLTAVGDINAIDFNSTSDQRLKTDISSLENALDLIKKVKIHKYRWKNNTIDNRRTEKKYSGENKPSTKGIGVLAQELKEIIPEAVQEGSDIPEVDGSSSPLLMVNYNYLFSVLVQAVQELSEKIDADTSE